MTSRSDRIASLHEALEDRILLLDGAMGTMVQGYRLEEADFRGERFRDHPKDLKGNNDFLNLSRPDVIGEIHTAFLAAGSDIVETNTFSGTTIAQADYGAEALVDEINVEGARIARQAADAMTAKDPSRPRFVAGALGPTNRTASISPDVNNPGFRNTSFDELVQAYGQQAAALVDGGVDMLLVETIFDTLNAKAAIFAIEALFDRLGERLPVLISGTITDLSGRNLSGQTMEAFWYAVRHAEPLAIGLNCSFGAEQLRPHLAAMSKLADTYIVAYPNAGLPNELGEYDEAPETTAGYLAEWVEAGLVNIVGGCCGTTPEHLAAIAAAVAGKPPRRPASPDVRLRLAGLEPFVAAS